MAVWELYSKRRKKELSQVADVFTYDSIPRALRTQIAHMWDEAIGAPYYTGTQIGDAEKIQDSYLQIAQILRREYGLFKLSNAGDPRAREEAKDDLVNWFLKEQDNARVLDAIELTFKVIDAYCGSPSYLYGRKKPRNCRRRD